MTRVKVTILMIVGWRLVILEVKCPGRRRRKLRRRKKRGEKAMMEVILLQDNPKGLGGPTGPIRGFPQFVILWALRLGLIFLIC